MRVTVTCDGCETRQTLARSIQQPETFWLRCIECEGLLRVDVTPRLFAAAHAPARRRLAKAG